MKEIYMPNLLRVENIINPNNRFGKLDYFMDFNLQDNSNFRALISLQLANLLENLILFDRVYIDLIELPLFLKELLILDKDSTISIINNNSLSYLNIDDFRVGVYHKEETIQNKYTISHNKYYLTAYSYSKGLPQNVNQLEEYILSFFNNDIENFQAIQPFIKNIFESRKIAKNKVIPEEIVTAIDSKLKKGDFSFLGIGGNNYYFITDKNKSIYNVLCRLYRDSYITNKFDLYAYYKDDIFEVLTHLKGDFNIKYDSEFFKISNINKIPDFKSLFIEGRMKLKDVKNIIENKNILTFREWFFDNIEDENNICQEYIELMKKSPNDCIPMKIMRFIIPTIAGFIPVAGCIIGTGLSAIDSFLLDNALKDKRIKFIDNYSKIMLKANNNINDQQNFIQIPIKNEIIIDNTLSGKEALIDTICNELSMLETKIDFSNQKVIEEIYKDAIQISGPYLKYRIVLERFMFLCTNLCKKYTNSTIRIVYNQEKLYNIVKNVDSFSFAKEYYFKSYYYLQTLIKENNFEVEKNLFKINTELSLKEEYNNYIKNLK